ncbi:MAG TPA: SusC/RagA family TonB-linked outer membrane protein, partial [Chitinophagaceae bacterium]|nr:SusC/RagA family TonB-linked outer membrane protein [Chitinophagaceae bacterium]
MREKRTQWIFVCLLFVFLLGGMNGTAQMVGRGADNTVAAERQPAQQPLFLVLKELNGKKGVFFLFSQAKLGNKKVVPVTDTDRPIETILAQLLHPAGLSFKKIADNTYVILNRRARRQDAVSGTSGNAADSAGTLVSEPPVTVSGSVLSESGQPLGFVSIRLKGSVFGTATAEDGSFLVTARKGSVLLFTRVGYEPRELTLTGGQQYQVLLREHNASLREVVVTALGLRKDSRSLGYSVASVSGADLSAVREHHLAYSLMGRVAGVQVAPVSGGAGAAANVVVRGVSALSGHHQPLYVVNGVPVVNNVQGNNGTQFTNSPDLGDGIQNINPDDIESVTVLKGGAAASLYGSRAKSGVILITTKNGQGRTGIEYNSTVTVERVVDPTHWQYTYGNGLNNHKPVSALAAFESGNMSWGARLDGTPVVQFDGVERPYVAQRGNVERFYRTGATWSNTIAFSKRFDSSSVRLSAGSQQHQSVMPQSGLNRYHVNGSATIQVRKGLTVDVRSMGMSDRARNRPVLADGAGNANYQVLFLPTNVDIQSLEPGTGPDGYEQRFTNNQFATNPWFAARQFINNTARTRFSGTVSARYTVRPDFFFQLRAGRDAYQDAFFSVIPTGTAFYAQAPYHILDQSQRVSEWNADLLGSHKWNWGGGISLTLAGGANIMRARSQGTVQQGKNFSVPRVYTLPNARDRSVMYTDIRQEVQSLYGSAELALKQIAYLHLSGRNDWFSTLAPSDNLGIFYPSLSASVLLPERWKPHWVEEAKLRAGWANVGSGVEPYQTLLNYGLLSQQLNGMPLGIITNSSVPNEHLRPANAAELELGTEWRFCQNRFSAELTWYHKVSRKEIIPAPASFTSGYFGIIVNQGAVRNRGWELTLQGQPFQHRKGSWQMLLQGAVNHNRVLGLAESQSSLGVATSRTGHGFTQNIVGLPAVQVMAFDYLYDAQGKIVNGPDGLPARGALKPYGSAYHKYSAGWVNDLSWNRFRFSFL